MEQAKQAKIPQGALPPSREVAMALPEILSNVLTFLDRRSLTESCFKVSRLWRACSQPLLWRTQAIDFPQVISLFRRSDNNGNKDEDKDTAAIDDNTQKFCTNCHRIRSLIISITDPIPETRWLSRSQPPALASDCSLMPQAAGLKDLVHINIRLERRYLFSRQLLPVKDESYALLGRIISQNPGIRDLEWEAEGRIWEKDFVECLLKQTSRHLKRLSIAGEFGNEQWRIFEYLINANEKRRQWLQKRHQQTGKQAEPTATRERMDVEPVDKRMESGDGSHDTSGEGDGDGGCELRELVIKETQKYPTPLDPVLTRLRDIPGVLPIQSLTILDCEAATYLDIYQDEQEPSDTLLTILSKCPNLEKLCISHDLSSIINDSSPDKWSKAMADLKLTSHDPMDEDIILERRYFVEEMFESCPNLREIELGMFYNLTHEHWNQMMQTYGPQLESLSIWGNVLAFSCDAFMPLIGPPMSHPSRNQPHRLTRLNINGMQRLNDCAWMALYHLPLLKEFRARDVPLDARDLIKEGGWACKGLEVLEIFILVPSRSSPPGWSWRWSNLDRSWLSYEDDADIASINNGRSNKKRRDSHRDDYDDDGEDGYDEKISSKRRRGEEGLSRKKSKEGRKKHKNERHKDDDGSVRQHRWDRKMSPREYSQHIQTMICEAFGRLSQLRVLRIEGEKEYRLNDQEWGCLELTLETGLDRLVPLQHSLEKLMVSTLQEGLSGKKEVEWIARNWVHHQDRLWQEQHAPVLPESSPTSAPSDRAGQHTRGFAKGGSNGGITLDPAPKFKDLIGVSTRCTHHTVVQANLNIAWLQEQCPTLNVVTIDNESNEDFLYSAFQDF